VNDDEQRKTAAPPATDDREFDELRVLVSDQLMGMEDERRRNILEILSVLSVT
jgi:hypothetical protein